MLSYQKLRHNSVIIKVPATYVCLGWLISWKDEPYIAVFFLFLPSPSSFRLLGEKAGEHELYKFLGKNLY